MVLRFHGCGSSNRQRTDLARLSAEELPNLSEVHEQWSAEQRRQSASVKRDAANPSTTKHSLPDTYICGMLEEILLAHHETHGTQDTQRYHTQPSSDEASIENGPIQKDYENRGTACWGTRLQEAGELHAPSPSGTRAAASLSSVEDVGHYGTDSSEHLLYSSATGQSYKPIPASVRTGSARFLPLDAGSSVQASNRLGHLLPGRQSIGQSIYIPSVRRRASRIEPQG